MLARSGTTIELIPTPTTVVMLFQDAARGYWRMIHLARGHVPTGDPTTQGDSTGKLVAGGLDIDTIGFSPLVWLNARGWRHSGELRLTEKVRLIQRGRFLECRVEAEDVRARLPRAGYVRYLERVSEPLTEDGCRVDLDAPPVRP